MMRRLRVLIDASSSLRGGGVTFASGVISSLSRVKGLDLYVIAPDLLRSMVDESGTVVWLRPNKVKLVRVLESALFRGHIAKAIGADVVLFLGNYGLVLTDVPAVVVAQLDPRASEWYSTRHLVPRIRWFLLKLLMRISYRRASLVAAVSEALAHVLEAEFGVDPSRISVIGEGVLPSTGVRNQKDIEVFAITGTQPYKGGCILAGALCQVAERFKIKPKVAGVSREMARRLGWSGTEGQIEWLGYLPQETVRTLYRRSKVFVYQSHVEAFGLPPLEAMAEGAVVVAPDLPAIREACGDAAVFFSPASETDLAEKVSQLLSDEELRSSLRAAGYKRAKQFTWGRVAQRLLLVLENNSAGNSSSSRHEGIGRQMQTTGVERKDKNIYDPF